MHNAALTGGHNSLGSRREGRRNDRQVFHRAHVWRPRGAGARSPLRKDAVLTRGQEDILEGGTGGCDVWTWCSGFVQGLECPSTPAQGVFLYSGPPLDLQSVCPLHHRPTHVLALSNAERSSRTHKSSCIMHQHKGEREGTDGGRKLMKAKWKFKQIHPTAAGRAIDSAATCGCLQTPAV